MTKVFSAFDKVFLVGEGFKGLIVLAGFQKQILT